MKKLLCTTFCLIAIHANAQNVVRGPYLQILTQQSVEVCWRTDVPTDSKVEYGFGLLGQTFTQSTGAQTTEHRVTLTGLQPGTKYYYSVGSSAGMLAGGHEHFRFKTSPASNEIGAARIWAIGDFGKANQGQIDVMNSYLDFTDTTSTDLLLMLGDNAYNDGTDQEFQDKLFNIYDSILPYMPIFSTPGNHDYNSVNRLDPPDQHTGPYFDIFDSPINGEGGGVPSGTELYYSFDYRNIHIISLNSEIQAWTTTSSSPMWTWLQQDLQANTKEWTIVMFHQPPYSKGSHDSDDIWEIFMISMRNNGLPILESYGVDLVLCGHSHVYERSMLIKDHFNFSLFFGSGNIVDGSSGSFAQGEHYVKYLNNGNEGTVYVVCGNSGSKESNADLDHPAMYAGDDTDYGSVVIDVNGNRLDCRYLQAGGTVLDHFTIIKPDGSAPVFADANEPDNSSKCDLYPNPSSDRLWLQMDALQPEAIYLTVTDVTGRVVHRFNRQYITEGEQKITLDIQKLPAGSYNLLIDSEKMHKSMPFTKQ